MNGVKLFGKELQRIVKDKKLFIPIIAILLVPLIYAGMFLWSFLDPYAKMDELPVAVVNNDEGAMMEDISLHLGNELVNSLEESEAFDFHFISDKEAMKGLDDLTYYMVIKIPENFSQNATTLLDQDPQKLQLEYISNDSYNFLASQIGETAISQIQSTMSHEVSKTYAETLFSKVTEMSDGFKEASDGSKQLNDGAIDLKGGATEIRDNLEILASKSIEFQNGISTAQVGMSDLTNGTEELLTGVGQLTDASGQLLSGSAKLNNGTNSLVDGLADATSGAVTLNENIPQLIVGTEEVLEGLKQFQASLPTELASGISEQLAGSSGEMSAGINQLHANITSGLSDELVPNLSEGLAQGTAEQIAGNILSSQQQQLEQLDQLLTSYEVEEKEAILSAFATNTTSKEELTDDLYQSLQPSIRAGVAAGVAESTQSIDRGFDQYQKELTKQLSDSNMEKQIADSTDPVFNNLANGLSIINSGQLDVQNGISILTNGLHEINAGAIQVGNGQNDWYTNMQLFADKMDEMKLGVARLNDGSLQLNNGMNQLMEGATQFSDGSERLTDGATQLSEGTNELQDGTEELATKLADASKKVGSIHTDNSTYDMMASPIDLEIHHANEVPNYGTGFAPYFISLGLFVGALLLTIIFPLNDTAGIPKTGISWFLSKFGVMALVGIIQAILTDFIILYGLDIKVQSVPLFFLFSMMTSLTFITLIQFLVTTFNNPGRFVAIIILILQLTSSAGTFPLEVIPKAVQWFNPLLPMTYSVSGFKAVISNGDYNFMWHNAGILFAFMGVSIILTIGYFIWKHKKQFVKNNQEEAGIA
ncbi:YhgE/Pip domain-containing protein [Ornithinibacillus scapharcae]|uniref:YhgE/Pip domain-containing protein n=1 Tax=Ornithinibacillus scapharcae TaxID=1147159 RepID=UPI000225AA6E|nr:YhgE/Pip domain-containing protein [Ornithinibacillus scapharcae]